MDACDTQSSASDELNEQIARQLFEVLPEQGPILLIMDRRGNCWPSNSEAFATLHLDETFLAELRAKIDDGAEPLVTQAGDTSVVVAQLATDRTNCGYLLLALPRHSPESTLSCIGLVEMVLQQANLVARLIERDRRLTEAHSRRYGLAGSVN